jgi:ketosteroid isomerase-like protein
VSHDVNDPAVVDEVRAVFERYERALIANDVDVLDELFWNSPHTVRFGLADIEYGFDAISTFRRSQAQAAPPRELRNTLIATFGTDVAVVTTEFVPDGTSSLGRQSQTWVRGADGWQVVSAHVSWMPA